MMENMQSFKTNDNVTLKYFDSGAAEEGEDEKPWLILVSASMRIVLVLLHFDLVSICASNSYLSTAFIWGLRSGVLKAWPWLCRQFFG